MKNGKITERIRAIAELIENTEVLADIGCDHAHISIYLAETGRVKRVIASDLREGPLNRAKKNVNEAGLSDCFRFELASGLSGLNGGEADTVLISGMGGILIKNILSEGSGAAEKIKYLVLEPQSDVFLVRGMLRELGFTIIREKMVKESGKYYQIIRAERTNTQAEDKDEDIRRIEDKFGPVLLRDRDEMLYEFLCLIGSDYKRILSNKEFLNSANEETKKRIDFIRAEAKDVKLALGYFKDGAIGGIS